MKYTGKETPEKRRIENMNFGSNNIMWILVLLLILGEGNNGNGCASCDTLIWLLLLSRYCGDNDAGFGCGCGNTGNIGRGCGV